MRPPTSAEIEAVASSVGVTLGPSQADLIRAHTTSVLEASNRLNLISASTAANALRIHIADSLAAVRAIGECRSLVDVGSGAGFPGVPLAVALECRVVLVESRAKRAEFLEGVAGELARQGLECSVEHGRAEDAEVISRNTDTDIVVMRAVSALPTLVELAAPYLGPGGRLVALKGPIDSEELSRGDQAAEIVGLGRRAIIEYVLPGGDERRTLVTYHYEGPPSVVLPRRIGRATKDPLG